MHFSFYYRPYEVYTVKKNLQYIREFSNKADKILKHFSQHSTFFIYIEFRLFDTLSSNSDFVNSVAFDTGIIIASGSDDKTIKLWNKNTGDLLRTLIGHYDFVNSVAFNTDNMRASGSEYKSI